MITFNETLHLYLDGETQIPSVTQILSEVYGTGLEGAPKVFVNRAADKGTKFHKEVHNYLITGELGTTQEFYTWYKWFSFYEKTLSSCESEKIVYAHTPSGSFAGTLDFLANGFIKDWKTCKTATRKQIKKWQMQLSMYIYAARQMGYAINEPAQIIRINDTDFEIIHVDYLGDAWVEKTMALYKDIVNGKKTQQDAILSEQKALQTVKESDIQILENTMLKIVELEKQADEIKERIKAEMAKRGIYSLTAGKVNMTYVSAHKSKKFDSKSFKAENEELYNRYLKETPVKDSLRVTIKE